MPIIICEGETEQEFCKDVLVNHFQNRDIFIQTPLIKKSGGGIVKWSILQKQIENHLNQEREVIVTLLIDFYGLNDSHKFPKWEEAKAIVDINDRMTFLEQAMKEALEDSIQYRFLPYIQLHEFEGLLFNNIDVFTNNFEPEELVDFEELNKIITDYPNPELLNDNKETAPSKRLIKLIKGYQKVIFGAMLAQEIGLQNIRNKCPRFNQWIATLEAI